MINHGVYKQIWRDVKKGSFTAAPVTGCHKHDYRVSEGSGKYIFIKADVSVQRKSCDMHLQRGIANIFVTTLERHRPISVISRFYSETCCDTEENSIRTSQSPAPKQTNGDNIGLTVTWQEPLSGSRWETQAPKWHQANCTSRHMEKC